MTKQAKHCPSCAARWWDEEGKGDHVIGIEYSYNSPESYDGISEWDCTQCDYREGRWSGNELKAGQIEPRFGVQREE